MVLFALLQSLHSRVFTENWRPVVAGIAVMLGIGLLSIGTGNPELLFATSGIGGLVAGFLFGKHSTATTGLGLRVGLIGASLAMCIGLVLMASGSWALVYDATGDGAGVTGVSGIGGGESGVAESDMGEAGVDEATTGDSGVEELSAGISMGFLLVFGMLFIPASALIALIGSIVGTNVRQAVIPDKYNPPLF
ncbi:hypothetical protein [Halorhabdus sp. SVX81]|uniref:hypothetical protein n=1 Tax=Halorhabdus sp. SVX81 TaxID=2978283 RepID=UPI0023DA6F16|nr:hypothetical protein [Halorhabdus sp. SVX81]